MKHYILLSAALLFAANLFAQTWTKHPVSATLPADSKVLHFDPTGKVWVGGPGIWLSVWDGKKWSSKIRPANLVLPGKEVFLTAIVPDASNSLIMGTNEGLIYQNQWKSESMGQYIVSVANDQKDIYVLDKKGINVLKDGRTPLKILPPTSCNGNKNSPGTIPTRILCDQQRKNIWTNNVALSTNKETWQRFEKTENARDITFTPDGRLAFVTQSGQLCFFNKTNDSLYTYTVQFKNKTPLVLQSATAAPDGSWWFTTNDPEIRFFSVDKLTGKSLKQESAIAIISCNGGDWTEPELVAYETFDTQTLPQFPGGTSKMNDFLRNNTIYPEAAKNQKIQGTVAVSFVVEKDGSLTDIKLLKDIGGGCGEESLRLVKSMPNWIPGQANGKVVKVKYTLPVRFRLE